MAKSKLGDLLEAYQRRDPAARSKLEVFLLYPGVHAVLYHRIAHWFYNRRCFFVARWISQHARRHTGIEIHPGAVIGKRLVIDHGMDIAGCDNGFQNKAVDVAGSVRFIGKLPLVGAFHE